MTKKTSDGRQWPQWAKRVEEWGLRYARNKALVEVLKRHGVVPVAVGDAMVARISAWARPFESDMAYIEAEMAWLQARCKRIIFQFEAFEQEHARPFRVRGGDHADAAETWARLYHAELRAMAAAQSRLEATRLAGVSLSVDGLVEIYGLSFFERVVLLMSVAPCVEKSFTTLYSELSETCGGLSVDGIFSFAELSFDERYAHRETMKPGAALFANDLVKMDVMRRYYHPSNLLSAAVSINARTFAAVMGEQTLDEDLMAFSSLETPRVTLDQVVLPAGSREQLLTTVDSHAEYLRCRQAWGFDELVTYGRGIFMLFFGPPGTGKTMTAHALAHRMGKKVLNVDFQRLIQTAGGDGEAMLPAIFREARLHDAVIFFDECETIFSDRRYGNPLMTQLLMEMERYEGVAIMATNLPEIIDPAVSRRVILKVRFAQPDRASMALIWRRLMPASAPLGEDVDVDELASRFSLSGGEIKNAVLMAVAQAASEGADCIEQRHLIKGARWQTEKLDEHSEGVERPKASLSDLVMPAALKDEVEALVQLESHRNLVHQQWGVGRHLSYGKGVVVLLEGVPGTGKTMCAEAMAQALRRPLIRVTSSTLLDKYVGGTESKIQGAFAKAQSLGAVLLFDEVDSIVGSRSASGPRHENSAINTMLTELERFDGFVVMTTNLPDRLDAALDRRLTARLSLPMPDAEGRALIWRGMFSEETPLEGEIDFEALGRRHVLSGGLIKTAALRAAFAAARAGTGISQALLEEWAAKASGNAQKEKVVGFLGLRASEMGRHHAKDAS